MALVPASRGVARVGSQAVGGHASPWASMHQDEGMEALMRRAFDPANRGSSYHRKVTTVSNAGAGLSETHTCVQDAAAGEDTISLQRTMGDRSVQLTRVRSTATGQERVSRDLRGVAQTEVSDFERRWTEAAERQMPTYSTLRRQIADTPAAGGGQQPPPPAGSSRPTHTPPAITGPPQRSGYRSQPPPSAASPYASHYNSSRYAPPSASPYAAPQSRRL
eukprot:TRINITY_DN15717_c0_g1_i1.p1 TRINITY_DN15717_c0_g1~~TRINITY_DN15717_c0_g1_i1.p1  ORF type:complete len:252 (+),score=58.97 TRINITY_DN15717_c0_g1_i1:99-758(+)